MSQQHTIQVLFISIIIFLVGGAYLYMDITKDAEQTYSDDWTIKDPSENKNTDNNQTEPTTPDTENDSEQNATPNRPSTLEGIQIVEKSSNTPVKTTTTNTTPQDTNTPVQPTPKKENAQNTNTGTVPTDTPRPIISLDYNIPQQQKDIYDIQVSHALRSIGLSFELSREYIQGHVASGKYTPHHPTTKEPIELPPAINWVDNTQDPGNYCMWAQVYDTLSGNYHVKSSSDQGYANTTPKDITRCLGMKLETRSPSTLRPADQLNTKQKNNRMINEIKQTALAIEVTRNQSSGNYQSGTEIPEEAKEFARNNVHSFDPIEWEDNSAHPAKFCIWSELQDNDRGTYFIATESGSGYSNTKPTSITSCLIK